MVTPLLKGFDSEELEVLNRAVRHVEAKCVSRLNLLKRLDFIMTFCSDVEVVELYGGLKSKVRDISDDEWEGICEVLPLDLTSEL